MACAGVFKGQRRRAKVFADGGHEGDRATLFCDGVFRDGEQGVGLKTVRLTSIPLSLVFSGKVMFTLSF